MKRTIYYISSLLLAISLLLVITHLDRLDVLKKNGAEEKNASTALRTSGALQALNFWTKSRAYPANDIPADKFFIEYKQAQSMKRSGFPSLDDTAPWQSIGPLNIPGRMISVALNPQNPNTLYAGSASGGLWRTYSAQTGENWQQISTGFPTLGVMAIAIDPTDTTTMFIGSGEVYGYQKSIGGTVIRTTRGSYGFGILKTTDSGLSWSLSLDWTAHLERGVQCIRLNPLNPHSLYAATTEGIYKSTDAGETWQHLLDVLMAEDIIIHPADTSRVMVSCGNMGSSGSGLYRTTDDGSTWTRLSGLPSYSGKTMLGCYAANPDIVFASVADSLEGTGLYRTDNFGTTWSVVHNNDFPRYQGWYSHWVAVHPTDLSQIIHAGVYVYKSNNEGNTWSENQLYDDSIAGHGRFHGDHHAYVFDPIDPNIIYVALDQGVFRSTDFGENYATISYGLQTGQFYKGFSTSNSDSNFSMGGLQDNNSAIFTGTPDWTKVMGGDGCWTAINTINDNIIYGESQVNRIQKSINRGQVFYPATNGMEGYPQDDPAFVAPYVISPSDPYILYSGRRRVFKTINGANHWFPVNNGIPLDGNPALSMAISSNDPNLVFVGTGPLVSRAHVFRTTDGGVSWTNISGSLPNRYPLDLAVDPNDDQNVYLILSGYGSGHVFKSTNSGNAWQDISGNLPDVPTSAIAIDPFNSGHLYVGNDLGVYASTDGGSTWDIFSSGLPEAVIAMDLDISAVNRKLRLATHGSGVYQRPLLHR
ncbi:MAG: hypothetical protein GY869_05610, partial [Planctomycetes bacterium]|nr:hypothetical protein [Planctomycetota bacterium]